MARGTCWVGYEQKGFKKKGNKSVPNCVKVGTMKGDMIDKPVKAYTGRAVRQPTETDTEFAIRHEYHTPFGEPEKAYVGKFIDVELDGQKYSNASKKDYYKGMI